MRDAAIPADLTLAACLSLAARRFRGAGIDTPERDARILVAAALGLSALDLIARPEERVSPEGARSIGDLVRRRLGREPVSRILGRREFYGREFSVTPATLDPRPDTETLVDLALAIVREEGLHARPIRIIDVGTGTGCILTTLLLELPLATGLGTDISPEALATARANADRLGAGGQARFELCRSLEGMSGPFDLLVSNPPYIPSRDLSGLDPEVRDHDPNAALDGGPDGLNVYREIARGLPGVVPAGWAAVEVGEGQADMVREIIGGPHASATREGRDLGGRRRCVAVRSQR